LSNKLLLVNKTPSFKSGHCLEKKMNISLAEDDMSTDVLFSGDEPRFEDVEIDASVLPTSFTLPLLTQHDHESDHDAARLSEVIADQTHDEPLPQRSQRKPYQCHYENCEKFAQAGGFCIGHGGGYKCQTPFCAFFNLRTCPDHGGSKRCAFTGCTKVALGASGLCCAHGGGRKCGVKKCDKYDAGLGFCLRHGGGRNCTVEGCTKKQIRYGLCSGHGGRARCKVEGCDKYDRGHG
jgi:hypothetical protein